MNNNYQLVYRNKSSGATKPRTPGRPSAAWERGYIDEGAYIPGDPVGYKPRGRPAENLQSIKRLPSAADSGISSALTNSISSEIQLCGLAQAKTFLVNAILEIDNRIKEMELLQEKK